METPQADAKTQPVRNRIPRVFLIVFVVIGICSVATLVRNRANTSRIQLDVQNTGSNAVLLRHRGNDLVVRPGESGALRFSPGDTLTIFAGETERSKSKSVQLENGESDQAAPAAPPRVAAEVNADGENIVFQYVNGT